MATDNSSESIVYTSFLGTGWGFPPEFSRDTSTVGLTSDHEDIQKSIEILLSTTVGERIMQPEYGCNLYRLLFEPLDTSLKTFFKDMIKRAFLLFEPRVKLDDVAFETDDVNGIVKVILNYQVIATNNRYNMVYPFYIGEASSA